MIRWLIAGLLVAGLAIGVWMLWPSAEPSPSSTTIAAIDTTTSTSLSQPSTTTTEPATSTTAAAHVVTTVEEAEAILADLWFGWFEGIYNQDEARIREVVGSQTALDNAVSQFGVMEFTAAPTPENVTLAGTEILRSDASCLVVWTTIDVSGFREGSSTAVHVLRRADTSWVSVSLWEFKGDLWQNDCESPLLPLS